MPRLHRAAIILLATLTAVGAPPTRAQVLAVPAAAVTAVTVADPSPSESRVLLTFGGALPEFTIANNDSPHVAVTFTGARMGAGASLPGGGHGPIQSLATLQNYGLMTLVISGAGPVHASAQTAPGGAVLVTVSSLVSSSAPAAGVQPPAAAAGFAPLTYVETAFEVVPLKYADVSEIVGLLTGSQGIKPNDNFNPQEPAFGSASLQGLYTGGGFASSPLGGGGSFTTSSSGSEPLGTTVDDSIGVDRRLNAIILKGSPEQIGRLKDRIAKLDVAVTSVVLETVFVELTQTGAKDLGIDWNNANGQIGSVSYAYSAGSFPGVSETGKKGGVALGFQAAIYAQIAKGEGQIISKPRIAAQSGQTAKIVTGDALPILTSIALSGVNAVQQQVQYVNVGVTLQIAPRVSDDGVVTSHIFAVVSSVTGYSQGYPTISQREASTSATVRDGESFIIGGLTQETSLHSKNKIPLLGDIPLVGTAFSTRHNRDAKTELYVVITPHVVHGNPAVPPQVLRPHFYPEQDGRATRDTPM